MPTGPLPLCPDYRQAGGVVTPEIAARCPASVRGNWASQVALAPQCEPRSGLSKQGRTVAAVGSDNARYVLCPGNEFCSETRGTVTPTHSAPCGAGSPLLAAETPLFIDLMSSAMRSRCSAVTTRACGLSRSPVQGAPVVRSRSRTAP